MTWAVARAPVTWAVAHTPATVCPPNGRVLCSLVVGTHAQPYRGAVRWAHAPSLSLPTTGSPACSSVLLSTICLSFCSTLQQAFAEHLLCVGRGGGHWQNQLHVPAFWGAARAPTVSVRWPSLDTLAWIQNFANSQVSHLCLRFSPSLTDQSTCRLLNALHPFTSSCRCC